MNTLQNKPIISKNAQIAVAISLHPSADRGTTNRIKVCIMKAEPLPLYDNWWYRYINNQKCHIPVVHIHHNTDRAKKNIRKIVKIVTQITDDVSTDDVGIDDVIRIKRIK